MIDSSRSDEGAALQGFPEGIVTRSCPNVIRAIHTKNGRMLVWFSGAAQPPDISKR
jgi:hypothetical protein